jgi:hypothetical protein
MTAPSLAGPLLVVIWWISIWGLADILMSGWSKTRRLVTYAGLLLLSLTALYNYPHLIERL